MDEMYLILKKIESVNIKGNKDGVGISIETKSEVPYSKKTDMYKLYKNGFYIFTCESFNCDDIDIRTVEAFFLKYGIEIVSFVGQYSSNGKLCKKLLCKPIRTINIERDAKITV